MILNQTQEDYTSKLSEDNSLPELYLDRLYNLLLNFKFSKFTPVTIDDACTNEEFKQKLYNMVCHKLNVNPEELINNFENSNDENSVEIRKMIKNRYARFQMVIINFLYEQLPFNYLRKIANNINDGKLGSISNIYDLINDNDGGELNIRKQIMDIIELEIQKINNIDSTLLTLSNQIQNKEQFKKLNTIKNATNSVSKKVIQENLLILSILDTCPIDCLNTIILDMLDDDLIASNILN
jgi:hypothetical protein